MRGTVAALLAALSDGVPSSAGGLCLRTLETTAAGWSTREPEGEAPARGASGRQGLWAAGRLWMVGSNQAPTFGMIWDWGRENGHDRGTNLPLRTFPVPTPGACLLVCGHSSLIGSRPQIFLVSDLHPFLSLTVTSLPTVHAGQTLPSWGTHVPAPGRR